MKLLFRGYEAVGDWLAYNGMIRYLLTFYDEIYIQTSIDIVKILYRDEKRIKFGMITENNTDELSLCIWEPQNKIYDFTRVLFDRHNKIGKFFNVECIDTGCDSNDSAFYFENGIPKYIMFDYFYFKRDQQEELELFNRLCLQENEYIVICEYNDTLIDRKYINNNYKIINLHHISKFFDILQIIEHAREVHLIENSTARFVYFMQKKCLMKLKEINLHAYANNQGHRKLTLEKPNNIFFYFFIRPKLDNWNIIYNF